MSPTPREKPSLLFVDDEQPLLHGLRNVLHGERARWDQRFAQGGEDALRQLQERPADVVVTDMRMPQMDGLALLGAVKQQWPRAARIVLSGYADLAVVAQASAVAHQYLLKPCDPEVLKTVIDRALQLQALLGSEALQRTVGTLGALPSTPRLYQALTGALADPDVPMKRLARLVEEHLGMSTRVLQFVNSAYYGLTRHVSSIEEALVLLGIGTVRQLALTLEVAEAFGPAAARDPGELEALERHGLLTARIARRILGDPARAEIAFAAGLLHDCGKIALMSRLPEQYAAALDTARREGRPVHEVERELLGANHAEIGGYLLGLWGIPHPIVEAVAFHHDEERVGAGALDAVAAVGAANLLARSTAGADASPGLAARGHLDRLADDRREAWLQIAAAESAGLGRVGSRP